VRAEGRVDGANMTIAMSRMGLSFAIQEDGSLWAWCDGKSIIFNPHIYIIQDYGLFETFRSFASIHAKV